MIDRLKYRVAVCVFAAFSLVNACGGSKPPIRIATNPWPGYELLQVAKARGYFDQLGVKVELVDFMSLGDSSRAFARGQVDVWGATLAELLINHANSKRMPRAFWVTDISAGADMLLARKGVYDVSDLPGKRVAVEPETVHIVLLHHALRSKGLGLKDVQLVLMPMQEMKQALEKGEVDVVCVYPPVAEEILEKIPVIDIFNSSMVDNTIVDVLAAAPDVLESRRQDFVNIVRAFERARDFLNRHRDQALQIMAKREGLSIEQIDRAVSGIKFLNLEQQRAYLRESGLLSKAVAGNLQALIETEQLSPGEISGATYTDLIINAF